MHQQHCVVTLDYVISGFALLAFVTTIDNMAMLADVCAIQAPYIDPWTLVSVLSIPHFLYLFVWMRPEIWQNIFGKSSLDIFASCGVGCKGTASGGVGKGGT